MHIYYVQVQLDDDGCRDLHWVVKTVPRSSVLHNLQRFARPFLKEAFWYAVARPQIEREFPELAGLSPTCYFANCTSLEEANGGCVERKCCALCYMPCRRKEAGIIVLQDLTKVEPRPFYLLDKNQVPGLAHVRLIMEAIGRCESLGSENGHLHTF